MATKKSAAAKVAPTVSPEPDAPEGGGESPMPADVFVPDAIEIGADAPEPVVPTSRAVTPAGTGTAPAPSSGGTPAPAAGITTPGAGPVAGEPHGYGAWMMPAPVALATAPVGSSGYYMGIKVGVDTKTGPFASWLGTDGPRASWPN